jgi:hypothetical protein
MKDTSSLRILCLGDSLTSGYFSYGTGKQPYSITLENRLKTALEPWSTDLHVVTNGVPGLKISFGGLRERLEYECSHTPLFSLFSRLGICYLSFSC